MATRPLPTRPVPIRCAGCGGRYSVEYDEQGTPTAFHTLPYCAAFEAISTSIDALEHFEECRKALPKNPT